MFCIYITVSGFGLKSLTFVLGSLLISLGVNPGPRLFRTSKERVVSGETQVPVM